MVAVVASLLLLLALAGFGSYRDLAAAEARRASLEERIEQMRERNAELSRRIERLQDDPASLERIAREQYRMMKPGDVVILFPEETAPRVTQPLPAATPTSAAGD